MKTLRTFLIAAALNLPALAVAPPIEVEIIGTPTEHQVQWSTRPCYNYTVECSPDLQTWNTVGTMRPGTGDWLAYDFTVSDPRTYYRIREHDLGFLTLPCPGQQCFKEDGVRFGFNLANVQGVVRKICISKRPNANAAWEPIGKLTDIATLGGLSTVRGPAVWIPATTGTCEIKAEAFPDGPGILATAIRQITIVANAAPTITIIPGPPTSAQPLPMTFTTDASDTDAGDEISRVEFYDAGQFLGTDRHYPFGDSIENLSGEPNLYPSQLLAGIHTITARAYDTRGGMTETAVPYTVTVTAGNSRPVLDLIYPTPNATLTIPSNSNFFTTFTANDPNGSVFYVFGVSESANEFGIGGSVPAPFFPPPNFYVGTQFTRPGLLSLRVFAEDNNSPFRARSYERFFKVRVTGTGYPNSQGMADTLADGTSAIASNAFYSGVEGPEGQIGNFTNTQSPGLDMSSGLVLSTGKFKAWDDGNLQTDTEYVWRTPGDTVLEDRITSSITRDAATLEFDVDCPAYAGYTYTQLECEVQFASEEYPEYFNGSDFHDSFAVTVDGVPVSLVPDGASVIRADTIHPAITAPGIFLSPPHLVLPENLLPLRAHLYQNGAPPAVEYDGLTVRLRLHAFVTPGAHRIRFSIADTDYTGVDAKGYVDSALFIKAGSLRTCSPAP